MSFLSHGFSSLFVSFRANELRALFTVGILRQHVFAGKVCRVEVKFFDSVSVTVLSEIGKRALKDYIAKFQFLDQITENSNF